MPDPNARRDKALEDISRTLKSIDVTLKALALSAKHSERLAFQNYIEGSETDGASNPAGSAETGSCSEPYSEPQTGPYGTGTTHPYT